MAGSRYGADLTPNQFGDATLSSEEAMSACGPALAVAFARANGRNPTLREALDLAKATGWTAAGGMNGIANERALLGKMGIDAQIRPADAGAIAADVQAGKPVGISTAIHYWVADDYDPATGKLHVGNSGRARRGGSDWMSLDDIAKLDGGVNGTLHMTGVPAGPAPAAPVPRERQSFLEANDPGGQGVPASAGSSSADSPRPAAVAARPDLAPPEQPADVPPMGQTTTQQQQQGTTLGIDPADAFAQQLLRQLGAVAGTGTPGLYRLPGRDLPGWRPSRFSLPPLGG